MRWRFHRPARCVLGAVAGLLLLLGAPATGPAQGPPGTAALKQKSAALAAESQATLLQLYALESRLGQARSDLARTDARATALERQQDSARRRHAAAQRTLTIAQQRLAQQLRLLYEQDQPDPIAVVLGATSLAEAIDGIDTLNRTARATKRVVEEAHSARALIRRTEKDLAARVERTKAAHKTLAATAASLEQARSERAAYLAQIRRQQALTVSQIATLEERAQEARRRAQVVTRQAVERSRERPPAAAATPETTSTATPEPTPAPAPQTTTAAEATTAPETAPAVPETAPTTAPATTAPPAAATTVPEAAAGPSEPPPAPVESVTQGTPSAPAASGPPRPGGTMSVYATGYCLRGATATGLPVGPGIVAVDPTAIPLGTRMSVPGYGEGVAADTGGAIRGARIDVWFASCKEAAAFGRTVTITFG